MNQEASKTVIETFINIVPAPPDPPLKFRNYYLCRHDGTKWHDDWNHLCNDRCPVCDGEIEPSFSEDIED